MLTFSLQTDDDTTKKRKVTAETEKKAISIKKPPSKDKGNSTTANAGVGRTLPKPTPSSQHPVAPPSLIKSTKQTGPVSNSGPSSQSNMKLNPGQSQLDLKTPLSAQASKLRASQSKTNLKEAVYEDIRQPSETLHARMQARVQAQITQIKQQEPVIPSESIELPDINSEYVQSSVVPILTFDNVDIGTQTRMMRIGLVLLTLLIGLNHLCWLKLYSRKVV